MNYEEEFFHEKVASESVQGKILMQNVDLIDINHESEKIKKVKKSQKTKEKTIFRWTKEENLKYANYLQSNQQLFSDKYSKRKCRTFQRLSIELFGAKTSEQCRGHHKKMEERYKTINGIIQYIRKQFQEEQSSSEKLNKKSDF